MLGSGRFISQSPVALSRMVANLNLEMSAVWGPARDLVAIGAARERARLRRRGGGEEGRAEGRPRARAGAGLLLPFRPVLVCEGRHPWNLDRPRGRPRRDSCRHGPGPPGGIPLEALPPPEGRVRPRVGADRDGAARQGRRARRSRRSRRGGAWFPGRPDRPTGAEADVARDGRGVAWRGERRARNSSDPRCLRRRRPPRRRILLPGPRPAPSLGALLARVRGADADPAAGDPSAPGGARPPRAGGDGNGKDRRLRPPDARPARSGRGARGRPSSASSSSRPASSRCRWPRRSTATAGGPACGSSPSTAAPRWACSSGRSSGASTSSSRRRAGRSTT